MDAYLVARELEMALLAKLLENGQVDAESNLTMPASALLHLLRSYLGDHLTLSDLERAAATSALLTWTPYKRDIVVGGIHSSGGVRLDVWRWHPCAASRIPFEARLNEHADRERPPIAATSYEGGALGPREFRFEVRNEGYGTQADLRVTGVVAPDWVEARHEDNAVFLAARPQAAGVYRGAVTVQTNANALSLQVSARSAAFALPGSDEVLLSELLPDHPDLDRDASEALLEDHLTRLHFERLPGGLFVRRGLHAAQPRSAQWWLDDSALEGGSVPATGYPDHFLLYLDVNGDTAQFEPLQVTSLHGQLGGEFAELFDLLDVQAGQKLTLSPFQGGFKATLSPAEPWRTAVGHTYWLQGPYQDVLSQPDVLEFLLRRCDDRNITVNLLLCGEGELPADLLRQHRAGRLTIRWTSEALPYRLLVRGEHDSGYRPPFGPLQRPVNIPQVLWETATPLGGQDYREQAWQRGRRGEGGEDGLLDLELSVGMDKLAQALAPAPVQSVAITPAQRDVLLDTLPRRAREAGVDQRPVAAAPILKGLGVSAAQVNAGGNGYRVTAGGYLVRRAQDVGRQKECAAYVGGLYGGVLHHSQLRKLTEVFMDQRLEPTSFVMSSLDVMGWAGNGYRRPRQGWEPVKRDLVLFVAEALVHFDTPEAAQDWLRRHVAASEEQLARALDKAQALLPALQARIQLQVQPADSSRVQPPATHAAAKRPTPGPPLGAPPSRTAAQPASPPPRSSRPAITFRPLPMLGEALPDPRGLPPAVVSSAAVRLVAAEGPMTESWLLRRYAQLTKLNPRQVSAAVGEALAVAVEHGALIRTPHPCGTTDVRVPDQDAQLRERGARQPEDIPLDEWCALLRALGLSTAGCDEAGAFAAAAEAYRFGTAAAAARPLILRAWTAVQAETERF